MAIVLVIDTALGRHVAVLAELLVAGPLIAATGATARHTAAVALLALVISVPARDRVRRLRQRPARAPAIIVVAVGGAVSVVIARLRTQRERNEAARWRFSTAWRARIAESDTFDDAAPRLLEAIARPLGRELAQFWTMHDDEKLRRVAVWRDPDLNFEEFERASGELSLAPGWGFRARVVGAGPSVLARRRPRRERHLHPREGAEGRGPARRAGLSGSQRG